MKIFFKIIHIVIIDIFYLQYILVSNPKYAITWIKTRLMDLRNILRYKLIISAQQSIFAPFKILNFIYKPFIYFNAFFGVGIITFYTFSFNDIINTIINFINSYKDSILIYLKNIIKNLSEWIDSKVVNKNIVHSAQAQENIEVDNYNLRKEYNQSDVIEKKYNNSLNNNLIFYTGLILIIGGITFIAYNNWDILIDYLNYKKDPVEPVTPIEPESIY